MMEISSPRPWTGSQEMKHELLMRTEELERLIAMYKDRLCSGEMADCPVYESRLTQDASADVDGDQRGRFYEVYMRKREVKLREEWRARGAEKEAEKRARMESLASALLRMTRAKSAEPKQRTNEDFKELSNEVHHNDSVFSNDHPAHINQRKLILSSSSSRSSSTSRSSAASIPRPDIRSSTSASLRKENTKPSPGVRTARAMQRSIGRSNSSKERTCLVKDMKTGRPQPLRRNSSSVGERSDFMALNPSPRGAEPMGLLKTRNGEVRNPMDSGSSRIARQSYETLKEGDEHGRKPMFFKEPPVLSLLSGVREAIYFDDSVDSPRHGMEAERLQHMNQMTEGKTQRERKKWGTVERPRVAADASGNPLVDVTKGIKRLLKLGKKSRGMEVDERRDNDGYGSANYALSGLDGLEGLH